MRIILVILLLVPLALADEKIQVRGLIDGDKIVFDCTLDGFSSQKIKSSVNPCDGFKSKNGKTPGIEVEVTLHDLDNIDEFRQFASEYRDFIKILKLDVQEIPENFSSTHLMSIFALIPSLIRLEIGWNLRMRIPEMTIDGHNTKFLPNLKALRIPRQYDIDLLNFLSKFLTKDTLHELSIEPNNSHSPDAVAKFIESQKNIKILKIGGYLSSPENFQDLKLEKFNCEFEPFQNFEARTNFLTEFISNHPEIFHFNGGCSKTLNDEMFTEICKLENLTSFEFYIDDISKSAIGELKNIKNLKSIGVDSSFHSDMDKMDVLSKLEMPGVENVHLSTSVTETPEIYEQFGQNYPNLKSLKVDFSADQTLNFFMRTFPRLENLSLVFKRKPANTLENSFKHDSLKHENMKRLSLEFDEDFMVEIDLLTKLLESFPNLEELHLDGSFYFTPESLRSFLNTKIKRLSVSFFRVPYEEEYSSEIIGILKEFNEKFESFFFVTGNKEVYGSEFRSCPHLPDGEWKPRSDRAEQLDFSSLIKALKDNFGFYKNKNFTFSSQTVSIFGETRTRAA